MSITSLTFVAFMFATILVYYLVPPKYQWIVLLFANGVFYSKVGWKAALFVLFTAVSVWTAARWMEEITARQKEQFKLQKEILSKEDKKAIKKKNHQHRKWIMLGALLANVGILCVTKYTHFVMEQLNFLSLTFGGGGVRDTFSLIVPLGISFYTFQTVGYLLDVYWEKIPAQKNFFRFLLFVSFFPQMTQGPISDYESLSREFFTEHSLTYEQYAWGFQRVIWGFFKKMVIADAISPYVSNVFLHYSEYSGITTLVGAFLYSIQIYADFSGYMDIMCGLCEVMGITLKENFNHPYFSKSIAEYWRRWHMTLGEWFKNYIYYPIGMSDWSRKIAKSTKKRFGAHFSNTLPATIALLIVWTATGLWHGASWAYIVWGLLNGAFIIFSMWMEPVYAMAKSKLRICDSNRVYKCFQIVRTFLLVTFIKVLPEVGSLKDGIGLWTHIFTDLSIPAGIREFLPFLIFSATIDTVSFGLAMLGVFLLFVFSCIQTKKPVRYYFNKCPFVIRVGAVTAILLIITIFGVKAAWTGGGFMYANF